MNKIYSWIRKNVLLLAAASIALPVNAFIAYKNAKIDMLFADAISDNNFLQAPFIAHDINIQAIHTHFIKWPIVLLENAIGFNFYTHAIISFLLLLTMNAALVYVFYIFAKRNKFITAICLLLLTSVELMTGISANEGTLTMLTIRNIEIPITILATLILLREKVITPVKFTLATLTLAIIFVSDQLLLFTSVIGALFYAILATIRLRGSLSVLIRDKIFYIGIFVAAITSKIISIFISVSGIANFYEMHNTNDKLTFVDSFKSLFNVTLDNVGKIFDVFGAGFFAQQLEHGPLYFINIALLLITVYLTIKLLRKPTGSAAHEDDEYNRVLLALFCMYFLAMLIFTVLIPRELAGRYFAFLPIIGILMVAKQYQNITVQLHTPKMKYMFILGSLVTLLFFFIMSVNANNIYYKPKYGAISSSLGDTSSIINILKKENARAYITMDINERGYWTGQVIKQQYDEKTHSKLAIGSVFCGNYIIDRQFTRRSWVTASNQIIAVRLIGCDLGKIKQYLGNPTASYTVGKDDMLLIYKNDIRNKFKTEQFDTNSFVK